MNGPRTSSIEQLREGVVILRPAKRAEGPLNCNERILSWWTRNLQL
jgi:hypothetical protein